MGIYMIAALYSNNQRVGIRLFDSKVKSSGVKLLNVPEEDVKAAILNKKIQIENLDVLKNELIGTNGIIDRYTKIDATTQRVIGKTPIVILSQIGDVGYTLVDCNGNIKKSKNAEALMFAKKLGLANGKVVMKDNIEFISSISGEYHVEKVASSKVKSDAPVNINITIPTGKSSKDGTTTVAKHAKMDVEAEISENDVFKSMTQHQKSVLKEYYVWYTVDIYRSLAKNINLGISLAKTEKLAEIRGEEEWEFAGVWDAGFNGASKCTLGHSLRYEYYAVPRSEKSNPDAKIVFGESCVAEFFNITKEDIGKLVKARKIMSDEIEIMADMIANNLQHIYLSKIELLYAILKKLGSFENIKSIFGDKLSRTLINFLQVKIPFPKSLVKLCTKEIRKIGPYKFWTKVFPEYSDAITMIYNYTGALNSFIIKSKSYLDFVATNKIEGKYAYDPFDKEKSNRDEGKYNAKTRTERYYLLSKIDTGTKCRDFNYPELINLLDSMQIYLQEGKNVTKKIEESCSNINDIQYTKYEFMRKVNGTFYKRENAKYYPTLFSLLSLNSKELAESPLFIIDDRGYKYLLKSINSLHEILLLSKEDEFQHAVNDFISYINYKDEQKRRQEAEQEERAKREELERQAERAKREAEQREKLDKQNKEVEQPKKEDTEEKDKLMILKELMDSTSDIEEDYGIKVAKDILGRAKNYSDLSPKQKWRIDKTTEVYQEHIKNKTEQADKNKKEQDRKKAEADKKADKGNITQNETHFLKDNPDIESNVKLIIDKKDSEELKDIIKKDPILIKIAYSILRTGKASDKQLKHINNALKIIEAKEVQK